jgi:hypothetical protein
MLRPTGWKVRSLCFLSHCAIASLQGGQHRLVLDYNNVEVAVAFQESSGDFEAS